MYTRGDHRRKPCNQCRRRDDQAMMISMHHCRRLHNSSDQAQHLSRYSVNLMPLWGCEYPARVYASVARLVARASYNMATSCDVMQSLESRDAARLSQIATLCNSMRCPAKQAQRDFPTAGFGESESKWTGKIDRILSRHNMRPVLNRDRSNEIHNHLLDSTADPYLGEPQLPTHRLVS